MKHFEKIAVKFRKDLYPYSAGDTGMMREDFAKGQFKEFVEIIGAKTEKKPSNSSVSIPDDAEQGTETKNLENAPQNKSMSGRTTKNTK